MSTLDGSHSEKPERFRTMININTMFCQVKNTRPARMGIYDFT